MAEKRAHWHEQLEGENAGALVFLDESGANTQMTRWRGRSPVGQRLVAHAPHGHYKTSTLIAAIRLAGPCAPWIFDGPMNGEMFLAWVRQGLVPVLKKGDVVIMDNLATHKVQGVSEAIEAVGARLMYLPPYSPDYNRRGLNRERALGNWHDRGRYWRFLVPEQQHRLVKSAGSKKEG